MKSKYTLALWLILLLISSTIGVQAQWENPLVYYTFNENAGTNVADSSGNNFNGSADCNDCWETEGKFKSAFHFKGAQKIILPAQDIALSSKEGTVAFWLRLPQSSTSDINCVWWAGEYDGDMFGPQNEMHINSEFIEDNIWKGGEMAFVIFDELAKKSYFIYSDPWKGLTPAVPPSENVITLADNLWHHIACTWDAGDNMALYIDGQTIWDTMDYKAPNTWDCNLMTLGVANQRKNRRLNGYLDEFRIYNKELNTADIEALYNFVPKDNLTNIENTIETSITGLNVYPNPAAQHIYFYNSVQIETVEIYNLIGKRVLIKQVSNTKTSVEIDINTLSTGLYFIRAFDKNKIKAQGKFYKE